MVMVQARLTVLLFYILLLITLATVNGKARKNALGELFPAARVGRSFPSETKNCCREYFKRHQGLIPFPRVGRSKGGLRLASDSDKILAFLTSPAIQSKYDHYDWSNEKLSDEQQQSDSSNGPADDVASDMEIARDDDYIVSSKEAEGPRLIAW